MRSRAWISLAQIRAEMRPLIDVAEFNEGYRYAEFNAKTDRMAEYGLGALIAGGVGRQARLVREARRAAAGVQEVHHHRR